MCSFKALAWALDRGPLADPLLTAPQFVAVYLAPLTPKHGARKPPVALHPRQELQTVPPPFNACSILWLAASAVDGGR